MKDCLTSVISAAVTHYLQDYGRGCTDADMIISMRDGDIKETVCKVKSDVG